jgi:hypothetical protein
MPVRLLKGSLARGLPDYYSQWLMGGRVFTSGVGGKFTENLLYNNASDGSLLYVFAINCGLGGQSNLLFEWYNGHFGTLHSTETYPVRPSMPLGPGQIYSGNSSTCLGTHFGAVYPYNPGYIIYQPGPPIAIIDPGWSFVVECTTVNVPTDMTFTWLPILPV